MICFHRCTGPACDVCHDRHVADDIFDGGCDLCVRVAARAGIDLTRSVWS